MLFMFWGKSQSDARWRCKDINLWGLQFCLCDLPSDFGYHLIHNQSVDGFLDLHSNTLNPMHLCKYGCNLFMAMGYLIIGNTRKYSWRRSDSAYKCWGTFVLTNILLHLRRKKGQSELKLFPRPKWLLINIFSSSANSWSCWWLQLLL